MSLPNHGERTEMKTRDNSLLYLNTRFHHPWFSVHVMPSSLLLGARIVFINNYTTGARSQIVQIFDTHFAFTNNW